VTTLQIQRQQERKRRRKEKHKQRKQRTKEQRAEEYQRLLARRLEHIAELRKRWATFGRPRDPEELLDEIAACLFVGGTDPIDPSTLRRRYSPPIKIGAQAVRWPLKNLQADIDRLNSGRVPEYSPMNSAEGPPTPAGAGGVAADV
jgi:hypothetical protein